jgi:hypothetical protein
MTSILNLAQSAIHPIMKKFSYFVMPVTPHIILTALDSTEYLMDIGSAWNALAMAPNRDLQILLECREN